MGCVADDLIRVYKNGYKDGLSDGVKKAVKHGKWEDQLDGTHFCSECGCDAPYKEDCFGGVIEAPVYDYCPHCGAKMDLED